MPILAKLAGVMLVISTTACVDSGLPSAEEQANWRSGGKADGQTCDFDTMSAETYYNQFAYKTVVSDDGSHTWYTEGATWDVKATLDNGDRANLSIYFLANSRVIVEYSEEHRDGSQSEVLNQTVVVTRSHVNAMTREIQIDGVGTGTPFTAGGDGGRCAPGIALTYSGDLRSPGLRGDATQIISSLTTAFVIDPDHLDQVPNADARRYFQEDVASGKIKVIYE